MVSPLCSWKKDEAYKFRNREISAHFQQRFPNPHRARVPVIQMMIPGGKFSVQSKGPRLWDVKHGNIHCEKNVMFPTKKMPWTSCSPFSVKISRRWRRISCDSATDLEAPPISFDHHWIGSPTSHFQFGSNPVKRWISKHDDHWIIIHHFMISLLSQFG